ncbi:MAG: MFS transporter small subunit [Inquilinus sp.]
MHVLAYWLIVGIPLLFGVTMTLTNAAQLFH